MSKFFREENYSSYESDSSSGSAESFNYDSDEEGNFLKEMQASKYAKGFESESESSDDGKKNKSVKQKMWEEIIAAIKAMRMAFEDYQWQAIYNGRGMEEEKKKDMLC